MPIIRTHRYDNREEEKYTYKYMLQIARKNGLTHITWAKDEAEARKLAESWINLDAIYVDIARALYVVYPDYKFTPEEETV